MPNVAADGAIRMSRVLRAPIATVFDALVRPELLQRWMCPTNYTIARVEADALSGRPFGVGQVTISGLEMAIDAGRVFVGEKNGRVF